MRSTRRRRIGAGGARGAGTRAFRIIREQSRPVAQLCARRLPFVTPGLKLRFEGAKDSGDTYT